MQGLKINNATAMVGGKNEFDKDQTGRNIGGASDQFVYYRGFGCTVSKKIWSKVGCVPEKLGGRLKDGVSSGFSAFYPF